MSKKDRKIEKLKNKLYELNNKTEYFRKHYNSLQLDFRDLKEQKEFFERAYERHKGKLNKITNECKQASTLILNIMEVIKKYENAVSFDQACTPKYEAKEYNKIALTFDEWGCPLNHESAE